MKKIPTLFMRDHNTKLVYDQVTPGCEWGINGEGVATEKRDGTACLVRGGVLYKRYDAKTGRMPPPEFEPCEEAPDPVTGHWPGWVPVGLGPDDRWHREAWSNCAPLEDGTYELLGPKINGNPYRLTEHVLERHGIYVIPDAPRTFEALARWFEANVIEGIVWYHPDGRMCKIKRRDFGLQWP